MDAFGQPNRLYVFTPPCLFRGNVCFLACDGPPFVRLLSVDATHPLIAYSQSSGKGTETPARTLTHATPDRQAQEGFQRDTGYHRTQCALRIFLKINITMFRSNPRQVWTGQIHFQGNTFLTLVLRDKKPSHRPVVLWGGPRWI